MGLFPDAWRSEGRLLGKWVVSPLCVSLAAQAGTAPLIAYHFHQLAPLSLVANLAVVPLLGLVVGLGLLTALAGSWSAIAGMLFNGANYAVIVSLTTMVGIFANIPGASVAVPRPGATMFIATAAVVVLLTQVSAHVWARKLLIFVVLMSANAIVWRGATGPRNLKVVYLDVGQGDGAFLQFPNGVTMLVDAGNRSKYFDYGDRVVVPFLRTHNVGSIDVVVASHPHNDHIGGLVAVLEQMEVSHFLDSGQTCDTWTARRLRELVRQRGIEFHRVAAGDSLLGLGGVGALVLHPTADFVDAEGTSLHGLNNGSTVLRLDYGGTSLLFTGDAEVETDEPILRWGGRVQADILKVAHHGSPTSSRQRFIEQVRPQTAVVSVGAVNNFGHPSADVLNRFRKQHTNLYRTDRCGAVIVQIDVTGQAVWETMLANCTSPPPPTRP